MFVAFCRQTGRVDERCNCPLLPSSTGQLGRTLRLGRVLWCVASTAPALETLRVPCITATTWPQP